MLLCLWMFLGWSLGTGEPTGVLFSGKEYLCSQLFSVANSCLVGLRLHGLSPMVFVMFVHILLVQLQLEQLYWGDIMGIASNGMRWHNATAKPLILSVSYNQNQISLCNILTCIVLDHTTLHFFMVPNPLLLTPI